MANPAIINGYIPISNELLEQLALVNINGNQMRILFVVMRKTWGWTKGKRRKDFDFIALSQFEKLTGMNRRNVSRSLKELVAKRLLLKVGEKYGFNQNYEEWLVAKRLPRGGVANLVVGGSKFGSKLGVKRLPTKENTKETIQNIRATPNIKQLNTTNMGNQRLDDEDMSYEDINKKPIKKETYHNVTKRLVLRYMELKDERGGYTFHYKMMKEIIKLAIDSIEEDNKKVTSDNLYETVDIRFQKAEDKYDTWSLKVITTNFNTLIK